MVMDYVRSCYTTKARMILDSDRESNIIWYFADDGALLFPEVHAFGSRNWVDNPDPFAAPPIGEIPGRPRPWRNGSNLVNGVGAGYCGCAEAFIDGGILLPEPRPTTEDGLPLGCFACSECSQGCTPPFYDLHAEGFSADDDFDYTPWNGDWHLVRSDNIDLEPCVWRAENGDAGFVLILGRNGDLGGTLALTDGHGGDFIVPFYDIAWSTEMCSEAQTAVIEDPDEVGPWPTSLVVTPPPCPCS